MSSPNVSFGHRGTWCPIVVLVAILSMPPQVRADSFVLTSGKVIEGTVTTGSDISVFIKDKNGLLKPVMIADVAEVRVDLSSGDEVVGRLVGFRDDTYEIIADQWTLYIKDGRVVQSVMVHGDSVPAVPPNAPIPSVGTDVEEPASEPDKTDGSEKPDQRATM